MPRLAEATVMMLLFAPHHPRVLVKLMRVETSAGHHAESADGSKKCKTNKRTRIANLGGLRQPRVSRHLSCTAYSRGDPLIPQVLLRARLFIVIVVVVDQTFSFITGTLAERRVDRWRPKLGAIPEENALFLNRRGRHRMCGRRRRRRRREGHTEEEISERL